MHVSIWDLIRRSALIGLSAMALMGYSRVAEACQFENRVFSELDYGLYWFGLNDACTRAVPGATNAFYDQTKPTLIFVHGWSRGFTQDRFRETFNVARLDAGGPDLNLADIWIAKGWNVGILYWNQFADEGEVKNAESKIWSVDAKKGMRWRDSAGAYHPDPFGQTVTDLLLNNYLENLWGFRGTQLRFAGHSLGSQVVVTVAKGLLDGMRAGVVPASLVPDRIALLDAFSSNRRKPYLDGRWVGEVMRAYTRELQEGGVVFESYRSSPTTGTPFAGDANQALHNMTAFAEMRNGYFGLFAFRPKHLAAPWRYFWSFAYPPPPIAGTGDVAPSASTSNVRIRQLQRSERQGAVNQIGGQDTKDPRDDVYRYRSRL